MKKVISAVMMVVFWGTIMTLAQARELDGNGQLSVNRYQVQGTFDYSLYYGNGQLQSLIRAPQRQMLNGVDYQIPLSGSCQFHLIYAGSPDGVKGTGADSDWQSGMPNSLWYDGNIDFYGSQQLWQADIEQVLAHSTVQNTSLIVGYRLAQSMNELRNVNYHIVDFSQVGNETQADNGSRLNARFEGIHVGLSHSRQLSAKWRFSGEFGLAAFNASAVGIWNNHDPAWVWQDRGFATGYEGTATVKYAVSRNVSAQIGYRFFYAQTRHADERLDEGQGNVYNLRGQIGLAYRQQGIYYGLEARF